MKNSCYHQTPQEGAVLSKNETAEDVSNRGEHIRRGLNNVLNNY